MILDERELDAVARATGVRVYDYRTDDERCEPKAQPLDVSQFDVPEWAKWLAMDEDGNVSAYASKPTLGDFVWFGKEYSWRAGVLKSSKIDWRQTLTPVNQVTPTQPAYLAARGILKGCFDDEPSELMIRRLRDGADFVEPTRPATVIAGMVALLDAAALAEFAAALVAADVVKADRLIDALIGALEMPHDDVDVDEQLRVTQ